MSGSIVFRHSMAVWTECESTTAMKTLVLTPSASELPPGWSAAEFREAIQRAADLWSYPNVPCSLKVTVAEPQREWRASQDGTNLIAVRGHTWCHNDRCGAQSTFPLRATAMTTTYPEGTVGRAVVEADVEINGSAFRFTGPGHDPPPAGRGWAVPLQPVLLHEIGHVLGLGDVCGATRMQSGRPLTSTCSSDDLQRVMFASGRQESLSPGDVAELCRIYPPEGGVAVQASSGGSPHNLTGHHAPSVAVIWCLLMLIFVAVLGRIVGRRRSRRQR
jgi:hypothetical protein